MENDFVEEKMEINIFSADSEIFRFNEPLVIRIQDNSTIWMLKIAIFEKIDLLPCAMELSEKKEVIKRLDV